MGDQLAVIVKESGLESTKAEAILTQFQDYFSIAAEWEIKAKAIVVTDESQKAEMKMARAGRLFLKEKRVTIEKTRKELKEQALREGKAIDGIANVLKALIVPIEEYLNQQEKFVEIRAKALAEEKRIAEEAQAEQERLAKEAAEKAEQERIRLENEKLKADAAEKERIMAKERAEAEAKQRAIENKAAEDRRAADKKAKEAQDRINEFERRAKADAEKREEAKAKMITCPFCKKEFQLN